MLLLSKKPQRENVAYSYNERSKLIDMLRAVIASEAKQSQEIVSSLCSSQGQLSFVVHYRLSARQQAPN